VFLCDDDDDADDDATRTLFGVEIVGQTWSHNEINFKKVNQRAGFNVSSHKVGHFGQYNIKIQQHDCR